MGKVYSFQNKDEIYEAASQWVVALDRDLSHAETSELHEWLASNAAHRDALYEMAEFWDKMNSLSRLSSLFPDVDANTAAPVRRWRAPIAAAASILLFASTALFGLIQGDTDLGRRIAAAFGANAEMHLFTGVGERTTFALDDGSELTLNTSSQVDIKFSKEYRDLILQNGELHIQVAKDESRPLRVFSADKLVQAVGTAFSVKKLDHHQVELTVTEGKVIAKNIGATVNNINKTALADTLQPGQQELVSELSRGERALLSGELPTIETMSEADIESALSWKRGELVFRGEPLQDAVTEVNRYTHTPIVISDSSLNNVRIAGLFRAGDIEELLAGLEENFGIGHRYTNKNTIELVELK